MAREHLVASVPLVRILDRVGVHVPAIAVPVHVHRAQDQNILARKTVFITALRILAGLNSIRDIKVRQFFAPIRVF